MQLQRTLRRESSEPMLIDVQTWNVHVPIVAESYRARGLEAMDFFSKLASRIATSVGKSKSVVLHEIYERLNIANATAILSRCIPLEFP